jgi:hypothetical protein
MQQEKTMFEGFGHDDPRKMPSHLFSGALHLDFPSSVRADVSKQNCSICPRHWYIDAAFRCARCGEIFVFRSDEQRFWYEELGFWVDSRPRQCGTCRRELREVIALRQEYDRDVGTVLKAGASLECKKRLVNVIDLLNESDVKLPEKVLENHRILMMQMQIERLRSGAA